MITRETILLHVQETYSIEPDYPWARNPNYAVFRHINTRKWFGAMVDVTQDRLGLSGHELIDVLLLKCYPLLIGALRREAGILPGYHMNKEHWITVLMDGTVPEERIYDLIALSFGLTQGKK